MALLERLRQIGIFCLIAFAACFDYGFSSTYLNTPVDQFQDYLNESLRRMGHEMSEATYDWMWNLILNIWFVGFFVGIWFSPLLNDRYGRKIGFLTGCFFAFIGACLRVLAIVFYLPELLFVGRLLTSICIAVTYQSCILYLQECSPTDLRGLMSFLSEIFFAVMCLLGTLLGTDSLLGDHLIIYLSVAVPFCAFSFVILLFLPETPKFLLLVKKNEQAARDSIIFYHGKDADADKALLEIAQEAESEELGVGEEACEKSSTWAEVKELFTEPHLRKAVLLSCAALQNTVALWSILLSSTYFLEQSNVSNSLASWSSSAMTFAYVVGTLTGAMFIEKVGRRVLLLSFTVANNLFLILFVVCSQLQPHADFLKYGCLLSLVVYGFTYGAGVGPISWFISSELVPQRHRSLAQSVCYAINTVMVVATTFSVLPLYNSIGSYSFLILYSIPSFFCVIYLFRYLPETKGKEIHQVVAALRGKPLPINLMS